MGDENSVQNKIKKVPMSNEIEIDKEEQKNEDHE
jgi:hypothetical protein